MKMRVHLLISMCGFSLMLYASDETLRDEIQLRIQPVGKVFVQSRAKADNKISSSGRAEEQPGQDIYQRHCVVCHKDGLAGAPRFRNQQDWNQRLDGRTLDDLLVSSLKGLNAMPAKGTCTGCNEDDLKAALSYMLPTS